MAETNITRNLGEIDARIKQLSTSLKTAEAESRAFDKALRVNPNSLSAASARMGNLKQQIQLAGQQLGLLREKQAEYDRLAQAGTPVTTQQYEKLASQIRVAEANLDALNAQQRKMSSDRIKNMGSALQGVARVAKVAMAAIIGFAVAAAEMGATIADNSAKIGVSYRTYQLYANQFERLTGNANDYVAAMNSINNIMGQIAKGNTAKAEKALSAVGLTLEDIQGLSMEETYEVITSRLREMTDETERTAAAIAIFGNAGSSVAIVTGTAADEISRMNSEYERNSLLSDETVSKAAEMDDKLDELKARFKTVAVELGTALAPALNAIAKLASSMAPVIEALANAFAGLGTGGQIAVLGGLAVIAMLPGLITGIAALKEALDFLASNPVMAAVAGVVALGAIVGGAALLTAGLSNAATSAANNYSYNTTNNSPIDNSYTVINVEGDVDADEIAYQLSLAKKQRGY